MCRHPCRAESSVVTVWSSGRKPAKRQITCTARPFPASKKRRNCLDTRRPDLLADRIHTVIHYTTHQETSTTYCLLRIRNKCQDCPTAGTPGPHKSKFHNVHHHHTPSHVSSPWPWSAVLLHTHTDYYSIRDDHHGFTSLRTTKLLLFVPPQATPSDYFFLSSCSMYINYYNIRYVRPLRYELSVKQ